MRDELPNNPTDGSCPGLRSQLFRATLHHSTTPSVVGVGSIVADGTSKKRKREQCRTAQVEGPCQQEQEQRAGYYPSFGFDLPHNLSLAHGGECDQALKRMRTCASHSAGPSVPPSAVSASVTSPSGDDEEKEKRPAEDEVADDEKVIEIRNAVREAMAAAEAASKSGRQKKKSTAKPRPVIKVPFRGIGPVTDTELNQNDVLSGRGGYANSYAGNRQFRDLVRQVKTVYLDESVKKLEKAYIAAHVVNTIRNMNPPGRFLKYYHGGVKEGPVGSLKGKGCWYDIGDAKAIKKVGQALREDADEVRNNGKQHDPKNYCITEEPSEEVASQGMSSRPETDEEVGKQVSPKTQHPPASPTSCPLGREEAQPTTSSSHETHDEIAVGRGHSSSAGEGKGNGISPCDSKEKSPRPERKTCLNPSLTKQLVFVPPSHSNATGTGEGENQSQGEDEAVAAIMVTLSKRDAASPGVETEATSKPESASPCVETEADGGRGHEQARKESNRHEDERSFLPVVFYDETGSRKASQQKPDDSDKVPPHAPAAPDCAGDTQASSLDVPDHIQSHCQEENGQNNASHQTGRTGFVSGRGGKKIVRSMDDYYDAACRDQQQLMWLGHNQGCNCNCHCQARQQMMWLEPFINQSTIQQLSAPVYKGGIEGLPGFRVLAGSYPQGAVAAMGFPAQVQWIAEATRSQAHGQFGIKGDEVHTAQRFEGQPYPSRLLEQAPVTGSVKGSNDDRDPQRTISPEVVS